MIHSFKSMKRAFRAVALLSFFLSMVAPALFGAGKRMIIDTDPGIDDAVSIITALRSPDIQVEAVTVVAGNVPLNIGSRNARIILETAGRSDIPVAAGAARPLLRKQITALLYHGKNGIGDLQLPDPKMKLASEDAADLIIQHVHAHPGEVTIVALGPLTNIALALLKDPSIAPQIAEISFMGGTILSNGNTTPVSTFNIYADPEAAKIVVNSGIPKIIMVGTDVTTKVQFSYGDMDRIEKTGGPAGHLAAELGRYRLRRAELLPEKGNSGANMAKVGFNDLPAMVAAINSSLFTIQPMNADVETKGELTYGEIVASKTNRGITWSPDGDIIGSHPLKPNLDVATEVNENGVRDLFLTRVSQASPAAAAGR